MGFCGNRSVRHRASLEAFHDRACRFDFFKWDRLGVFEFEVHQATQSKHLLGLIVYDVGILGEYCTIALARCKLELVDRHRAEQVTLAACTPLVDAAGVEGCALFVAAQAECFAVAHNRFGGDGVEADALDARCGLGEILVDHVVIEADRFEDLCAAVGGDGRDSHLRHRFNHAVEVRLEEVVAGLFRCQFQVATVDHIADRLECEVWVDQVGAVAKQQRKVVYFAGLTGLEHDGNPCTCALADQVVMEASDCKQGRNRRFLRADLTVGKHQDVDAVIDGGVCVFEQLLQSCFEAFAGNGWLGDAVVAFCQTAKFRFERDRQLGGFEAR